MINKYRKTIVSLAMFCALWFHVIAQMPQKMSFQAVIRNAAGNLVTNHAVGIKVSILQGSPNGTIVFQELFNPNPQTNANGLVSIEIGAGIPMTGTFSGINWSTGPFYLKTETDPLGGTNYTYPGLVSY
jgi:trimeric autotransporter adhesin